MLYEFMANKSSRPVWFTFRSNGNVLVVDGGTSAIRSPSPNEAVCTIRSRLGSIEGTSVEHTLLVVSRPFWSFVETLFQFVERASHHILHLAAPIATICLAIHHIPPVAHLENIRTFEHTVPNHARELSSIIPVAQILGSIFSKFQIACYNHMP